MFNLKSSATAITLGIVAFLGLEAYGFYSIRRSLETQLSQIRNGIESVRAADDAMRSEIAVQATKKEPSKPTPKDARATAWSERIAGDRILAAKLQKMLPAGTSLKEAASGFKNEREFISAVHISKNLRIPFARLKAKITGDRAVPMEAAIRDLRPGLGKTKAKGEVERGERQARETAKLGRSTSAGA